ncbi:hypothetical protein T08_5190 [Trichinella sp. T8]|nr:hypothetical protein T08_5190 [Trichinella sp. T8]
MRITRSRISEAQSVRDCELVCLTYMASGKVVKRSMYLFCHYVITKIRQMKKRKSEKKDDTYQIGHKAKQNKNREKVYDVPNG